MNRLHFSVDFFSSEDDYRLYYSAIFVLSFTAFLVAHLFTKNILTGLLSKPATAEQIQQKIESEKIYQVLLEQKNKDHKKTEQIKALSDADSSGSGGLTKKHGFHTLSPFREFIFGGESIFTRPKEKRDESQQEQMFIVSIQNDDPLAEIKISEEDSISSQPKQKEIKKVVTKTKKEIDKKMTQKEGQPGVQTKIPFNYRFEQNFQFRWSASGAIKIPTKKLAGYKYFKHMLKKIEDKFAPPGGGNFAYRDMAGTVISQGIIPGEVRVIFLLNESGQVIDIKKANQHGQKVVEQACLDAIRGQNFGPVPEEIKKIGLIFGINFIFPGYRR